MHDFALGMNTANPPMLHELPEQVNKVHNWELETREGVITVTGRLVGWGSSRRLDHNHPGIADGNVRCSACRWTELYIFKLESEEWDSRRHHPSRTGSPFVSQAQVQGSYCVYSLGPSLVPNEKTFANVRWATSGYEVVELCTVRRGDRTEPFLPGSNARALAMAASHDVNIERAYVNRAIT